MDEETTVFWRTAPISEIEEDLLEAVLEAHNLSVFRENVSTLTLVNVALASGDYSKAIAAAILSIGGKHAPLIETCRFLADPYPALQVVPILERNQKVPGWGNSFHKNEPDPLWQDVAKLIELWPDMHAKLLLVTAALKQFGKPVLPNASAYTAAAAIIMKMPAEITPYLFIWGRLDGWTRLSIKQLCPRLIKKPSE